MLGLLRRPLAIIPARVQALKFAQSPDDSKVGSLQRFPFCVSSSFRSKWSPRSEQLARLWPIPKPWLPFATPRPRRHTWRTGGEISGESRRIFGLGGCSPRRHAAVARSVGFRLTILPSGSRESRGRQVPAGRRCVPSALVVGGRHRLRHRLRPSRLRASRRRAHSPAIPDRRLHLVHSLPGHSHALPYDVQQRPGD
jgi:hypothetical protein